MTQYSRRLLRHRIVFVAMSLIIAGGCAGNGCSCMAPLPNGFPAEKRQANAAQARLTAGGVNFIEANAPALVEGLLGGPLVFPIPPSPGNANPKICTGLPNNQECIVDIDVKPQPGDPPRLDLVPKNGNQLGLTLLARVKTKRRNTQSGAIVGSSLPFQYTLGITVSCDLEIDTTRADEKSLKLTADLIFNQDSAAGTTTLSVQNTDLANLDNGDLVISGGVVCFIADLLKGLFKDSIVGGFKDQIAGVIEDQLCKKCVADSDCLPFATCDEGAGTCMVNGANPARCLQELGTSGRLAGAGLLGNLSPGNKGSLDLYLVAGGYVKSNDNGMSLGILGGGIPSDARHDDCVPIAPEPSLTAAPESAALQKNARPDGQPFMLGIGLTKPFLDHAGWAAYDSGLLCLNVGTSAVALLNSETFSVLVDLGPFTHGQNSAVVLALRPQAPPAFVLGAGTYNGDGTIAEPLLVLDMPGLEIDFYTFVDERFSRLFTVKTDLKLPISLDPNDKGELVPVIGDVGDAFQNVTVQNANFTAETADEIAAKFPALLSVAGTFLGDSIGPIALPEVVGLNIKVPKGGLTSVDGNQVLAIFADLAKAQPKPAARVETTAAIVKVHTPPTDVFQRKGRLRRQDRPRVELALGQVGGDRAPMEWQITLDRGLPGPWISDPTFVLDAEQFWLQGRHSLAVRGRLRDQPETADPTPVELEVIIDSIAPSVALSQSGDAVIIDADDMVSGPEALLVEVRTAPTAPWQALGGVPAELPLAGVDPAALEVRVTDEAGNVAVATGEGAGFHGRAPSSGGCGCRVGVAPAGHPLGRGWLSLAGLGLGALGLMGWRRRRAFCRAGMPTTLVISTLVLGVLAGACGGGSIGGDDDGGGDDDDAKFVKPGALGRYVDLAAAGGRVVVVGYEDAFGDLVFSEVSPAGELNLRPVDGAPAGPVVLDPTGYRGGVKAPGENVGAHSSVALVAGRAIATYRHLDDNALLFGGEDGAGGWTRHVIDPGEGGTVGLYSSLTVDAAGLPGVAYMTAAIPDGTGFKAQLKWAQAMVAAPTAPTDWTVSVVHEARISCAGLCGDPAANVCVKASLSCAVKDSGCAGGCSGGSECVAGACAEVIPAPAEVIDLPEGPGLFASAGRLPDGKPVIAFYDRSTGDLELATTDGVTWTITPLDAVAETDTGQWSSLFVAGDGTIHVAYQNAIDDSLRYVSVAAGIAGKPELVDDGKRPDRLHPVGAGSAVFIDAAGALAIIYQDAADNDLLVARRDGAGVWTHAGLLTGEIGYGFYNAAAVDGGKTWVATFGYSGAKNPPGQVWITSM
jgi:hypothetical protein